ncbi:MAG: COG1470 family protein [Armatimonadota bacterium]
MSASTTLELKLSHDEIKIEPGGTAQLQVEIVNTSDQPDTVGIEVEGLDYEWVAIPVPTVALSAQSSGGEKVLLKVPRRSESTAGAYPFIVRARSLETGATAVAPATLLVEPFAALSIELYPRRGVCTYWRPVTEFEVTVHNLGNTPLDVRLYANDPDDVGVYTLDREVLTLQAGASETVLLNAEPSRRAMVGRGQIASFTVTARCVDNAYVAVHTQGQLQTRPLVSPAALGVFALLFVLLGAWAFTRPKPVEVLDFAVEPSTIQQGGTAILRWHVANAVEISITPDIGVVKEKAGSRQVIPSQTTVYHLVARGRGGVAEKEVVLTVQPAPEPPPPAILSFKAEPAQVMKGDPVILSWQVQNATKLLLSPIGELDPLLTSVRDTPAVTTTYTLVATNTAGRKVEKKVTVKVRDPNALEVLEFKAEPSVITAGDSVTLRWRVQAASRVVINNGVGEVSPQGEATVSPTQDTTYTLTATNDAGQEVTKSVRVTVTSTPPVTTPPPVNPSQPGH